LCPRFQSERESGDRNFAIGYYLKEKKVRSKVTEPCCCSAVGDALTLLLLFQCFPEGTDMTSILDFYFQVRAAGALLQVGVMVL